MLRHLASLVAATAVWLGPVAEPAEAQGTASSVRSAPVSDIAYTVTFDRETARRRALRVAMTFRTEGTDPVLLSLPAWTPGAYEVSNFARKVLDFRATTRNRPLDWDKVDHDTWRVTPTGAQTISVAFDYRADSLDNAMAWATQDFTLFNGTNVFFFPEGRDLGFPSTVTIETEADWQVATGMTATGSGTYRARDFHELVDMPVLVGALDVDSMEIGGKWYRLASYPRDRLAGFARETLWTHIEQMMPPMAEVFGETPWETYTTLLIFQDDFAGGSALEHRNSHVGIYQPQFIGTPILALITAHEIFHGWNVKRLRPADMMPYDYTRPQPTPLLWVSEGITDYYADLALVRGRIVPSQVLYQLVGGKINNVANAPRVALEDASLSTWIAPVDGSRYLYYDKGSLAGFLLDILIRDGSNNRSSLDDVLRELYRTTYKQGEGFTTDQWWGVVSRHAGGRSFEEFHTLYVDGRADYPWREVLPLAGLMLTADTIRAPRIGVSTTPDSTGIRVVDVTTGSAAEAAGVMVGDYVRRVGDVEVGADPQFGQRFRDRYAETAEGAPLPIVVRRDGEELTLEGELRFGEVVNYALEEDPTASDKARRIRNGILRGETGG